MIDTVRVNIKGGDGGNGCVSFLREKYKPKGGPNGGDGGNGGSAYLMGDPSLNTLLHLKFNSTFYVSRGGHGKGKEQTGANGPDTTIRVPVGTVVWRLHRGGEREFITDIVDETPRLVARGGAGGWGNAHYATSTNQEPMLSQRGQAGEYVVLFLELKLLADVGLLAKPNAGKSTLISYCSAAKPKIAAYPFTTVEPILGVVHHRDRDFVMMEVPGLLEGAHEGIGLGDQFLRHAERARVYIHLLDGLSDDPVADFRMINRELREFSPALAGKPQVIAVSKVDVTEVRELRDYLAEDLREAISREQARHLGQVEGVVAGDVGTSRAGVGTLAGSRAAQDPIFFMSGATGEGIDQLLDYVNDLLDTLPKPEDLWEPEAEPTAPVQRRPDRRPNSFYVEKGVYVVESEALERLSALADTRDYRVLLQLWREMSRLGIARKLEEAGIEPGDTIRIGRAEMEWF
jgi:GTP-binding protein